MKPLDSGQNAPAVSDWKLTAGGYHYNALLTITYVFTSG